MMLLADTSLAFDPAYPWSIPMIGAAAMLGVALALAALTVWTYLGVKQATWRRVLVVLFLRLAALAIVFGILARPSCAVTQLDGVETSKLLVVLDRSASMNVAEVEGKPTRWDQVANLWKSPAVQRRLQQLAADEKIEVVKHLGAEDLRPDEINALPDGKRTDVGAWLHELWLKHGHEKHVRGIAIFSDGADNGTRFPVLAEARQWRGVAPIHVFGVGDPHNAKFKKDLGLTKLDVKPELIYVKAPLKIEAVAQAPGFDKAEFEGTVWFEDLIEKKPSKRKEIAKFKIEQEKDQKIKTEINAPEGPGEYKLTLRITPHPDETNQENNEISTYVQVGKERINVLWVDRPRVYEPTQIIQRALKPVERLKVHHITLFPNTAQDRMALYELDEHYDVIVIGDVSAQQFSLGNPKVFARIHEMVTTKKTGLLMLGGSETFAKGGWQGHAAFMSLLPVDFNVKGKEAEFSKMDVQVEMPTETRQYPFLELDPDPKKNAQVWKEKFEALEGLAPVGEKVRGSTELLRGANGNPVLIVTRIGGTSHVAVFAGDSTSESWFRSQPAVEGFTKFWRKLILWLANQEDHATPLLLKLDKRRMSTDAADVLGFTVALRDKKGNELRGAEFKAKVVRDKQEYPARLSFDGTRTRGSFEGAKEPGEHQLIIEGNAKDAEGNLVTGKTVARFLVATDDIEMLRPLAEHEALSRIAVAAEGRFHLAQEEPFVQFLDELQNQVSRASRHKTTHWPDWKRLPASDHVRDQMSGLWNSFALVSLMLFVALLGSEWLLRRTWGLV